MSHFKTLQNNFSLKSLNIFAIALLITLFLAFLANNRIICTAKYVKNNFIRISFDVISTSNMFFIINGCIALKILDNINNTTIVITNVASVTPLFLSSFFICFFLSFKVI